MIGLGGAGAAPVNAKNMPVLQAFNRNAPQLQGMPQMEPGGAVMQAHLWGVSGLAQAPTSARTTQALALNAVQASGPVGQDVSLYPTHHSHGGDLMGWGRTGRGAPLIMDPQLATSQHNYNIVLPQGQVPQGSAASGQGSAAALGLQPGLAAAPALAGSQERALEQQMQAHLHGSRLGALEQVKMQGSFSLAAGSNDAFSSLFGARKDFYPAQTLTREDAAK